METPKANKKAVKKTEKTPLSPVADKPSSKHKKVSVGRTINVNNRPKNEPFRFCTNYVSTARYNVVNFIFKNLFEQFSRAANFYFLIISIIQLIPDVSPTGKFTTLGPLSIVLLVTAVKEAYEDYKRHRADDEVNNSSTEVFLSGEFVPMLWKNIQVGDIVRVSDRQVFPADLVLLNSSEPQGMCYIETSSLDGETNLKIRQALSETCAICTQSNLTIFEPVIRCEDPNNKLYHFEGTLEMHGVQFPLSSEQILLRGAQLRNTRSIFGVVIYTGHDSKLMRNANRAPHKSSTVEKLTNRFIMMVFGLEIIIAVISAILSGIFFDNKHESSWYLSFNYNSAAVTTLMGILTFLILYNNLIPISLYVSMEMVKVFQAFLMNNDLRMYDSVSDTPAQVRSSSLNEELGQIQYLFSDKTGTLTCNQMNLMRCSIGGTSYGSLHPVRSDGQPIPPQPRPPPGVSAFTFYDERINGNVWNTQGNSGQLRDFFTILAVCHTVIPERISATAAANAADKNNGNRSTGALDGGPSTNPSDRNPLTDMQQNSSTSGLSPNAVAVSLVPGGSRSPLSANVGGSDSFSVNAMQQAMSTSPLSGSSSSSLTPLSGSVAATGSAAALFNDILYQASSPDEGALVTAAQHLGFFFHSRSHKGVTISVLGRDEYYEVLNVLEFSSDRKRMSVIVRYGGQIMLLCKGADSVIFDLLDPTERASPSTAILEKHLQEFASEGLRTLVIAKAVLDPAWYQQWNTRYQAARVDLVDRQRKVEAVSAQIEQNLVLVGATAIEDKLQDEVPETISTLADAGIKIWVLTGDKIETAINIGFSCSLLSKEMNVLILTGRDCENFSQKLEEIRIDAEREIEKGSVLALVIDGHALTFALEDEHRLKFLYVANLCKSVICCRVSPLQKALVVKLVRDTLHVQTLSIGDGANDVPMIQAADVGVGISGLEGLQAARAADFSIAQFRFLKRLLLVHGRWNYRRISKLICYSFYKNVLLYLTQFWFVFFNGFSGQTFYDKWAIAAYNVVFTALPVVVMAIFDKDVADYTSENFPELYQLSQRGYYFNTRVFASWIFNAIFHSLLCFFITMGAFYFDVPFSNGQNGGLDAQGIVAYTSIIIVVTLKVALESSTWTGLFQFTLALSIGLWFLFLFIWSNLFPALPSTDFAPMYHVPATIMDTPLFWLTVLLTVVACLYRDYLWKFYKRSYGRRNLAHVLQDLRSVDKPLLKTSIEAEQRQVLLETMTFKKSTNKRLKRRQEKLFRSMANYTGFNFTEPQNNPVAGQSYLPPLQVTSNPLAGMSPTLSAPPPHGEIDPYDSQSSMGGDGFGSSSSLQPNPQPYASSSPNVTFAASTAGPSSSTAAPQGFGGASAGDQYLLPANPQGYDFYGRDARNRGLSLRVDTSAADQRLRSPPPSSLVVMENDYLGSSGSGAGAGGFGNGSSASDSFRFRDSSASGSSSGGGGGGQRSARDGLANMDEYAPFPQGLAASSAAIAAASSSSNRNTISYSPQLRPFGIGGPGSNPLNSNLPETIMIGLSGTNSPAMSTVSVADAKRARLQSMSSLSSIHVGISGGPPTPTGSGPGISGRSTTMMGHARVIANSDLAASNPLGSAFSHAAPSPDVARLAGGPLSPGRLL